jgi:hypothetical protein
MLVYSVLDSAVGPRLITTFAVTAAFVASTVDPAGLGEDLPVTTHYNAYVEGLSDAPAPILGARHVVRTAE